MSSTPYTPAISGALGRLRPAAMLLAVALCAPLPFFSYTQLASAQSGGAATAQRVIQGKVLNADGAPQQGAIVYLKNMKTLEVRTYISTADGSYRFGQLSMDSDFNLWADSNGKKSKEKTISSFDSKRVFDMNLKLDMGK